MAESPPPRWLDLDRLARTRPTSGWERNGACYETGDTARFYQDGHTVAGQEAIEQCQDCPALYACLATAVAVPETSDHGIWGGTSQRQRLTIRRRLKARRIA